MVLGAATAALSCMSKQTVVRRRSRALSLVALGPSRRLMNKSKNVFDGVHEPHSASELTGDRLRYPTNWLMAKTEGDGREAGAGQ